MRRLGLVLLLVVAFAAISGVWASSSSAYAGGPTNPVTNPANKEALRFFLSNPELGAGENATTATGLSRGLIAAGRLAPLTTMGTIVIGSYAVYKIADTGGLQGYIYKKITGDNYHPSQVSWTGRYEWTWNPTSPCVNNTYGCTTYYNALSPPGLWLMRAVGTPTGTSGGDHTTNYCWPSELFNNASVNTAMHFMGVATEITTGDTGVCTSGASRQHMMTRTIQQEKSATAHPSIEAATENDYLSAPSNQKYVGSQADDTTTLTDSDLAAAIHEIGADDSVDRTSSDPAAEAAVNWLIGHIESTPTFTPFVLPEPEPTETYAQYAARLRDRGWLGTLTVEPASTLEAAAVAGSAYEAAPLHAPAGIQVAGTSMVWVYDAAGSPLHGDRPNPEWPDNPPHVGSASTGITIKEKPVTSVLPPPSGGGGGGGSIDFSPITDLDPGCKFPYGLFCYAQDVTGWFDVTPDAPEFTFTINGGEIGGHAIAGGGGYDVDLGDTGLDGYMAIWRTLLSIALWVGAVWMLASRLLGLNLGDPGEAVDDADGF